MGQVETWSRQDTAAIAMYGRLGLVTKFERTAPLQASLSILFLPKYVLLTWDASIVQLISYCSQGFC